MYAHPPAIPLSLFSQVALVLVVRLAPRKVQILEIQGLMGLGMCLTQRRDSGPEMLSA